MLRALCHTLLFAGLLGLALLSPGLASSALAQETVHFLSADGRTALVGYLFMPAKITAPQPAIVLMHGRAGAYSSAANGAYTADTLAQRHRAWASYWAANGHVALLVDGFGPRGYPTGFGRNSYKQRPAEVDETVARPQDAYGALAFLRGRREVDPARVGLMGWSNGGSATLAALAANAPGHDYAALGGVPGGTGAGAGFRAGLALYPDCTLKHKFRDGLGNRQPLRILAAAQDDEVSPATCRQFVQRNQASGSDIAITIYPGAVHGFDDPGKQRQSLAANRQATEAAYRQALDFFAAAMPP